MPYSLNPFTGNLDYYVTLVSSTTVTIPEFTSDPVSPSPEEAWVLYTVVGGTGGNAGQPIGLLLSLTYAGSGGSSTYQFSYQTLEGSIKRVTLS